MLTHFLFSFSLKEGNCDPGRKAAKEQRPSPLLEAKHQAPYTGAGSTHGASRHPPPSALFHTSHHPNKANDHLKCVSSWKSRRLLIHEGTTSDYAVPCFRHGVSSRFVDCHAQQVRCPTNVDSNPDSEWIDMLPSKRGGVCWVKKGGKGLLWTWLPQFVQKFCMQWVLNRSLLD